jgi:aryl-alcohol dehydrogenase-like predicted oxidoreductase
MCKERLYLGTWQFGGQFKWLSDTQICDLLSFAWKSGIHRFDTAAVYGNGHVETLLGEVLPKKSVIVTKVPAVARLSLDAATSPSVCYPREWVLQSVEASLKRLRRSRIDAVLLHNWTRTWHDVQGVDSILFELKHEGLVGKIGISLPDGYEADIPKSLYPIAEVIEAPFNLLNQWIVPQLPCLRAQGTEVLLRSVFLQGMLLFTDSTLAELDIGDIRREKFNAVKQHSGARPEAILQGLRSLPTSFVIGMTTREQITENLKLLCEEGKP